MCDSMKCSLILLICLQSSKSERISREESESRLHKEVEKLSKAVGSQKQEHDAEKTALEMKLADQALLLQELDRQLSSQRCETSSASEALNSKHAEVEEHQQAVSTLKQAIISGPCNLVALKRARC